jgi:hypothetical protein
MDAKEGVHPIKMQTDSESASVRTSSFRENVIQLWTACKFVKPDAVFTHYGL